MLRAAVVVAAIAVAVPAHAVGIIPDYSHEKMALKPFQDVWDTLKAVAPYLIAVVSYHMLVSNVRGYLKLVNKGSSGTKKGKK